MTDPVYVCLCNAITDHQVALAAEAGATRPRQVFACHGCVAQCAGCTRAMMHLLRQGAALRRR